VRERAFGPGPGFDELEATRPAQPDRHKVITKPSATITASNPLLNLLTWRAHLRDKPSERMFIPPARIVRCYSRRRNCTGGQIWSPSDGCTGPIPEASSAISVHIAVLNRWQRGGHPRSGQELSLAVPSKDTWPWVTPDQTGGGPQRFPT
jgi:hypothetical protein